MNNTYAMNNHSGKVLAGVYPPSVECSELVSYAVNFLENKDNKEKLIYETGIGTGGIMIETSLLLEKSNVEHQIYGTDIHATCIENAQENISLHKKNEQIHPILGSYVEPLNTNPDLIIALLPWGSPEYLLGSNAQNNHGPEDFLDRSFFHPRGPMGAYQELCESIEAKEWSTDLIIETGCMPENLVRESLKNFKSISNISYIPSNEFKNYSITNITFKST